MATCEGSRCWRTNEDVLLERGARYSEAWDTYQEEAVLLKEQHGSWGDIPNKERTRMADNLRASGWIYHPETGWQMPNSVSLSSHSHHYALTVRL